MKAHDLSKESEGPTQAQKVEKAKLKGAAIGQRLECAKTEN